MIKHFLRIPALQVQQGELFWWADSFVAATKSGPQTKIIPVLTELSEIGSKSWFLTW